MIEAKPLHFATQDEEGQRINELEPHISFNTVGHHYNNHYKGYIKNLNKLIKGTVYENLSLEEIVNQASGPIYNNAAQAYNHEFYFNCLTNKESEPSNNLLNAIEEEYGTLDGMQEDFNKVAKQLFGSGWAWLVWDTYDKSLDILVLENAGNPLRESELRPDEKYTPLMVCDMWEHAFYLDHQHKKAEYLNEFWKVINWEFVNKNFKNK